MNKPVFSVGERVEKLCVVCNEVRGHVVVSITKRGQISRVSCPKLESAALSRAELLPMKTPSALQPRPALLTIGPVLIAALARQ